MTLRTMHAGKGGRLGIIDPATGLVGMCLYVPYVKMHAKR